MRARRIFRGALAGVMAVSLLFSGIPAAAAELNGPAPQNEAADNAGTDPMPKQQGNPGESEAEATGPQEIKDAGAQGDSQANTESPSGTGEEAPSHTGSQGSVETGATGDGSQDGLGTNNYFSLISLSLPGTRAAWKPVQKAAAGARTVMGMKKTVMEAKILLNRRKTQIQNRLAVKMGRLKKMRRQR